MSDELTTDGKAVMDRVAQGAVQRALMVGQPVTINGDPVVVLARPLWAQWRVIRTLFTGLNRTRLAEMVKKKQVRAHKAGDAIQCSMEYSVDDIDRVYGQEALGKKPRAVRREVPNAVAG